MRTLTVEYEVAGALDGTTAAPIIDVDPTSSLQTHPTPADQIYRKQVDMLGLVDPALMGGGGSVGPRLVSVLWIDAPGVGAAGASVDVVGVRQDQSVALQEQVEDLVGDPGPYIQTGILVPQGSALRLDGFTGPLLVRVTILVPEGQADIALIQQAGLWTRTGNALHPSKLAWQVVIGDTVPLSSEKVRVFDGTVIFDGEVGGVPVSGAGTRFMYIPEKLGSLRVGFVTGDEWDDANIGVISYAFGQNNKCSGTGAVAFGASNEVSGTASLAMGSLNVVAGDISMAVGQGNVASAVNSTAFGFENIVESVLGFAAGEDVHITAEAPNAQGIGEKMDVTAEWALGRGYRCIAQRIGGETLAVDYFTQRGDGQTSRLLMRQTTADDTPTEMTVNGIAPAGSAVNLSNRLILEDQRSYVIEAYIIGRDSGGAERASYKIDAVANRGAGAGTVTVDAITVTTLFETTASMDATISADVANGSVQLLVTGVAATDMRWVAHVNFTEVRFD